MILIYNLLDWLVGWLVGWVGGWVGCLHATGRNFGPIAFKFAGKFKYPERTDGIENGMFSHLASLSWGLLVKNKKMRTKTKRMYGSSPNLANL